jgi:hypothetical protein
MMKKEKLIKWEPLKDIPNLLYLEGLHHDYEGFRLILRDDKSGQVLRITFDPPLTYRNTDEGDLILFFKNCKLPEKWPLFKMKNSNYLKWFHEQSLNIREDEKPIHYLIITPDDCIDVISSFTPRVEWLTAKD